MAWNSILPDGPWWFIAGIRNHTITLVRRDAPGVWTPIHRWAVSVPTNARVSLAMFVDGEGRVLVGYAIHLFDEVYDGGFGVLAGDTLTMEAIPGFVDADEVPYGLECDLSGTCHLVVTSPSTHWVLHRSPAGMWTGEMISPFEPPTTPAALALDAAGRPHVFLARRSDYRGIHISWNGSSWVDEVIEGIQHFGESPSIAIDARGRLHFASEWTASLNYTVEDR